MLNFYQIVKENLNFNRFEFEDTVCLEYTCPINAEEIGIFSRNDYVVHVLSGRKTYKTFRGEWTLSPGQTLYLKKGAEIIHQYFDDEYCMLGFFITDDLIRDTFNELRGKHSLPRSDRNMESTAFEVKGTSFLESYFQSMLAYFRGLNRPPDPILLLKVKELLIALMSSDAHLVSYFNSISTQERPSISQIMENNFCFNLKLEEFAELCYRSLSSFKRDFVSHYKESPGKWLLKRRVQHAVNLLSNTGLSVTQVAFDSGFEDLSHFSRSFKKIMGVNPTELRQSQHS